MTMRALVLVSCSILGSACAGEVLSASEEKPSEGDPGDDGPSADANDDDPPASSEDPRNEVPPEDDPWVDDGEDLPTRPPEDESKNPRFDGVCNVYRAEGTDGLIDDFQDLDLELRAAEGRDASWLHQVWDRPSLMAPTRRMKVIEDEETGEAYLRFFCSNGTTCNSAWDENNPWQQWAALSTALRPWDEDEWQCYSAAAYTGVRFRAASPTESVIRIQGNTTDSNADHGETYQTEEIQLQSDWQTHEIPFLEFQQPFWSTVVAPFDSARITSLSFVVYDYDYQQQDGEDVGWVLLPYDIWVDDIEFY